jgi:hypothetical protein
VYLSEGVLHQFLNLDKIRRELNKTERMTRIDERGGKRRRLYG